MSIIKKLFFLSGFVVIASTAGFGQAAKSPFSSFGMGEYYSPSLVHNQGMAGVGVSNPQSWYVNNQNPALLIFNNFTTFEAGYIGETKTLRNSSAKEKNSGGNLNYLALAFPLMPGKWNTSLVLRPYTNVNYKIAYTDAIENSLDKADVVETGSGGINQLSWSHGVKITRAISLGARANYLFSSIERVTNYQLNIATSEPIVTTDYNRQHFSGFNFTGALSYRKDSLTRKNHRFNFGLVYDFKSDVKTKEYVSVKRSDATQDSILINNDIKWATLPQTLTAGISYGRPEFWTIGIDGSLFDLKQVGKASGISDGTTRGWRLAFGAEATPDPLSLTNYLKRMTYRTGFSVENSPYTFNGNTLRDYGIHFGLSLPVSRYSSLDFAVKWGKRGELKTNTIAENYFKIYFGVNFNDIWFVKRRFD